MVNPRQLPQTRQPGPEQPGSELPGSYFPDASAIGLRTVTATGVAIDSTGTTTVGDPTGRDGRVVAVLIDATQTDWDFNIELGGSDIFTSEQSPSSTNEERFVPDYDSAEFIGPTPSIDIDVSNNSSTNNATTDVDVITQIEEQAE